VEIGRAARARARRSAHVVFSVKSFGCIPSAGIADGIVPTVLGDDVAYLSVEVSGDGDAARESRIMLRAAAAVAAAEQELDEACGRLGMSRERVLHDRITDPLAAPAGARPYACALASAVVDVEEPPCA